MYPEELVKPMRQDLTSVGFQELKTASEVDKALTEADGSVLVVFNSVCGCAAGNARPGIKMAIKHGNRPDKLTTVFAGQDVDAVKRAREYVKGYPPSSPSVALFKSGKLVYMMERHQIEGHHPEHIAENLTHAFDAFLKKP
jgi:putative YphP/YqiW family bacilliredoxin